MKTKSIILLTIIHLFGSCANENPGDKATRVNKPASFQAAVLNEKTTNQPIVALQKKISKLKSTEYAKTNTVVPQTETRTLKTLYDKFEKPEQLIHINGSKDTILTLKEGTILKIPAGTFAIKGETMSVMGVLEIRGREYYSVSDIIFGNLTTQCGEALLESGGMINIEVRDNGNICSVVPGKSYEIGFPDKNNCNKMEMFEGINNGRNKIVWQHPNKKLTDRIAEVFTVVEEQPVFPGGDEARIKFLQSKFKYPEEAKELGIQGIVYITFVVETDGSITDIKVLRGIGGGCDEEAIRIIKNMPKWIPGKQRGVPVRVQFNLPVKFNLDFTSNNIVKKVTTLADSGNQKTKGAGGQLSDLNSWFISSYSTGWINCDRFVTNKQGFMDYIVEDPCADSIDLIMLLHRQKTIIAPTLVKYNKLIFKSIPRNESVTMIGIKVANNKIYMAIEEDTTCGQTIRRLTFKEVDEEGLKKALDKLDQFYL
jgi:TonB family protein